MRTIRISMHVRARPWSSLHAPTQLLQRCCICTWWQCSVSRQCSYIRHNAPADVRDRQAGRAAGQFHTTHKRFLLHLLGKPIALNGSSARTIATRTNLRAVDIFVMIPGMQNTTATGGRNLLNRHNHELFITYYVLHSMAAVVGAGRVMICSRLAPQPRACRRATRVRLQPAPVSCRRGHNQQSASYVEHACVRIMLLQQCSFIATPRCGESYCSRIWASEFL